MRRTPISLSIGVLVSALAGAAPAATDRATGDAQARVVSSGGIQVVTPLVFPTVQVTDSRQPDFAGNAPAVGVSGAVVARNARLTVRREAGEALAMAVPASFTVVRSGGTEALTVETDTSAGYGLAGEGVLLGGDLLHGYATSVDIGGRLLLASNALTPGPYEGFFAVVVQYN